MKSIKVIWRDATSCETKTPSLALIIDVGFLVEENEDSVTIAKKIVDNEPKYFLTIPKVLIKNMVELYEYWQFKKEMEEHEKATS